MIFGANIPLANATGIVEMMAIVEIRSGPGFPAGATLRYDRDDRSTGTRWAR